MHGQPYIKTLCTVVKHKYPVGPPAVKGFLSFSPLAVIYVPPDVTTSKLCEDLMTGYSVRRCDLQTVWFISVKK